jgi:hypothetical protein
MRYIKLFLSLLLFGTLIPKGSGQKNDTLYLLNGDRITGEIKKVESALVTLKTNAMKTVYVEVEDVNSMNSKKYFEFRTISGYRYYGSMIRSLDTATIDLVTVDDTIPKPLWDLVMISQIRNRFFQRIDGSIDLGLNYTKSIDVFQYNLNAWTTYRGTNTATRIDITSILSEQGEDEIIKNHDIGLNLTRYFPGKWFARTQVDWQENTQLNLARRLQLGPAAGYDIVRTSPLRLYSLAGILVNSEKLITVEDPTINVEGLLSLYFNWDQYHFPKFDISTGFDLYPSFTVPGRVRFELDVNIRYEIVTDVFINLSYYQNFDNKPSAGGASGNDYGVVTSLGYTF